MRYHIQFDLEFIQNTYSGKYFAFEGIDGSGKTTQVHNLAKYFHSQNKEVVITKEPTNNIIGQLIKQVIHQEVSMPSMSLQHLFAADRALHLRDDVIPALQLGKVVISDRSLWSAVAYGIADLNLSENEKERELLVHNVLAMYGGYLIPDKTYVIAVPAQTALDRIIQRGEEKTLYEKTEILSRVEKEYEWMAGKFSEVLKIVDGTKSVENVFQQIVASIM